MRGRATKEGMAIEKNSKLKEEPPLSGAYIRSLVKQLSSSRTKDPMNPKDHNSCGVGDEDTFSCHSTNKNGEGLTEKAQQVQQPPSPPPQQHKKQVRRRLLTSRPYQERLLNMAEARREIVTALKYHRAAMKQQQSDQQQQQSEQQQQASPPAQLSPPPCFEHEGKVKSRRNPRIYPSNTADFTNYLDNFSYSSYSQPSSSPYPFSWSDPSSLLSPNITENLNFPLPNQTLGLNLNFHDFNNIDTTLYHSSSNPSSVYSPSSPSSSSFPSVPTASDDFTSVAKTGGVGLAPAALCDAADSYSGGLHQMMDDEEMAEIRSIGEQHQMEWSDTMNLVTSAWWFKFMKTMELGPQVNTEDDGYQPFDQVMEFPSWMNANENDGCLLQQHFNDYCSPDYYQDPALPCMDIGEIDGMDGDWLS